MKRGWAESAQTCTSVATCKMDRIHLCASRRLCSSPGPDNCSTNRRCCSPNSASSSANTTAVSEAMADSYHALPTAAQRQSRLRRQVPRPTPRWSETDLLAPLGEHARITTDLSLVGPAEETEENPRC